MIIIIVTIIAIIVKGSLPDFLVALVYVFFFLDSSSDRLVVRLSYYIPTKRNRPLWIFFFFLFCSFSYWCFCLVERRKEKTKQQQRIEHTCPALERLIFHYACPIFVFDMFFFFVFLYFSRCLFVYYNIYFFFLCRKEGFRVELYILGGCK